MPLYTKRPVSAQVVEAMLLPSGAQATVTQGRPPRPGDYVVTDHALGTTYALTSDEFNALFEPLAVPSSVLAAEHQAQQEQRMMAATSQPVEPVVPLPSPAQPVPVDEALVAAPLWEEQLEPGEPPLEVGSVGETAPVEPVEPMSEPTPPTAHPDYQPPEQSPTGQPA